MDYPLALMTIVVAAGVSAASTPVVARLACGLGAVDRPSARGVNRRVGIPLLGGVAVAVGCASAIAFGVGMGPAFPSGRLTGAVIGGLLVLAIGAWDDRWDLRAPPKLAVQIAAAAVAIYFGFRVEHFKEPLLGTEFVLPLWLSLIVTCAWIVGVTNAANLMDGLDGLTAGIAAIITLTLTWVCWQANQLSGVLLGLALLGSLLGFLPFNFYPGRIFLGDSGAYFIGFVLSLLALETYGLGARKAALLTFVVPVLALGVPILDTLLSILRRMRRRAPIMDADPLHMHHRMLKVEGSQRRAVLWLYFLTACFCIIALSFTKLSGYPALAFLLAVVVLTVRLLRNLGVFSLDEEAAVRAEGEPASDGEAALEKGVLQGAVPGGEGKTR